MSDKNAELEFVNRLFEVEKNAAALIEEAHKSAEAKKIEATNKFNSEYKAKYDVMVKQKNAEYEQAIEQIEKNHEAELSDFIESLNTKEVYKTQFSSLLNKLLFCNA